MTPQSPRAIKSEETTDSMSPIQENPQGSNAVASAPQEKAMILHKKEAVKEILISDEMGTEVITIRIGPSEQIFSVHKNLIQATSAFFTDLYENTLPRDQYLVLKEEHPVIFKLFVDFLYSRRVPAVSHYMSAAAQALRAKQLCQLYSFADKFHLAFEIRNKIMDRIQDGFFTMQKFPEPGLVQAIYANARPSSKLRKFAIAGVYKWFRTPNNARAEDFKTLLRTNNEIMDDFLAYVSTPTVHRDPRIRQCYGWEGCIECTENGYCGNTDLLGVFPCEFHIHKGLIACIKEGPRGDRSAPGSNTEEREHLDDGCYLWSTFPDMEHMDKYNSKV